MTTSAAAPTASAEAASPYVPRVGKIVAAEKFTGTEKWYRIVMEDGPALDYKPGQFVECSIMGIGECPISICCSPTEGNHFELCVRAAGTVTKAMHELDAGDTLGIRGPFGNGFDVEAAKGQDMLFVGGGLGLAPMRGFVQYTIDNRADYDNVTIMIGAKTPQELLFTKDLEEWQARPDVNCMVTVDRGDDSWKGRTGLITTLFSEVELDPEKTVAVIVGPPIMFKFAVLEALSMGLHGHDIVCSLERRMKCGIGKCGHCQIRHVYVCQEGPVFTYDQVHRLREGI